MNKTFRKLLPILLLAALLLPMLAPAALASAAKAVVRAGGAKVYTVSAQPTYLGTLSQGTVVTVEAVKGKAALISSGGRRGICTLSSLTRVETASAKASTSAKSASYSASSATDVVTTRATRIYQKPSASSRYVSVRAGTSMKLLAVRGKCAMGSRGGRVGYTLKAHLGNPGSASTAGSVRTADFSGSNEQVIIRFLMSELGYNRAAACGVAANIKYESGYEPVNHGDRGSSYGICQWHAARKTRLISWCSANGYDSNTLKGQLYYLAYELRNYYPKVHNHLKSVEDSAQGAYDAGWYFCYYFEAPSGKSSKSKTRGNYAQSTLYSRYA